MTGKDSSKNRDLCLTLLRAETEQEVIAVLEKAGFWDDRDAWHPYGDVKNNRSIVGNQQSSAIAAFVEKVVNSIDAVLTCECLKANIDPRGRSAPCSMRDAVAKFFDVHGGRIQNLDATSRTRLAERIRVVATGTKEAPAYMVVDDGEGQSPDRFQHTFLSLLGENKKGIPFVQGKFNMGGTGVLQFAGEHSFQLVISRRQPGLPYSGETQVDGRWGFTLTRRLPPEPGQPHSTYVYLAPRGSVLAFDAQSLPLLPGRYPDAYDTELLAGTCLKIWNYKLPKGLKTLATLDLRHAFERYLQDPALPIRVSERRTGYRANFYDTTVSGLSTVLADSKDEIEDGMDTGGELAVPGFGVVDVRLVVIKELDGESKKFPAGVFFNINGQLHSEEGSSFIARRAKLDYLADSIIVTVDCTPLPPLAIENLFMASRDRMRQCAERDALLEAVAEYLSDHPGLKALNARRRQERLSVAALQEEASVVLQNLVRTDPVLASLFGAGKTVKIPTGDVPEPTPYEGREFPTFFRLHNEPREGLVKLCPKNRTCRVEFDTDAANDYFSRAKDQGRLEVTGMANLASVHVWNGRAALRFAIPAASNVGDRLTVTVSINDVSRIEPMVSSFVISVDPDAPPREPGAPPAPPKSALKGVPNLIEVRRDEWAKHRFNENSGLQLKFGDDEAIDVYVNMDNIHLKNEIARRKAVDADTIGYWYKYGLFLLALGMLFTERQRVEDAASMDTEAIRRASEGMAMTVVPVIAQLSKGRESR